MSCKAPKKNPDRSAWSRCDLPGSASRLWCVNVLTTQQQSLREFYLNLSSRSNPRAQPPGCCRGALPKTSLLSAHPQRIHQPRISAAQKLQNLLNVHFEPIKINPLQTFISRGLLGFNRGRSDWANCSTHPDHQNLGWVRGGHGAGGRGGWR